MVIWATLFFIFMQELNKKAYNYAIFLLSRRDYSIYKMKKKLQEKKYPDDVANSTIELLIEQNYLREEEYKRQRIKQLILKGYANGYIIQKLEQEKLFCEKEDLDAIRSQRHEMSTEQIIISLIEKKLRTNEIPQDKRAQKKLQDKVLRFLLSKGFHYSDVKAPVERALLL